MSDAPAAAAAPQAGATSAAAAPGGGGEMREKMARRMSDAMETLKKFFDKLGKKREAKIREEVARKLHENAGNMFRQGWFQVEATATIPNSLNLDVPFLSADMGSQYLRTVTDISRTPPAVNAAAGEGEGAGSASRTIHFMPLEFGLFDGEFPAFLKLKLYDKDVLPAVLEKYLQKGKEAKKEFQEVDEQFEIADLPAQDQVTQGMQIKKEFTFREGGKLELTLTYTLEPAKCNNTIVTGKFKEYLEQAINDEEGAKAAFKRDYPEATNYRYLLVPGLFTEYYPGYFSKNLDWMKSLGLDAQESKIKTTVGVDQNAEVLQGEIEEMVKETPDKKLVLIGHSKGGVDIIAALMKNPELKQHVFGFIAMQAPFGGSYMIEWVIKHADKAAQQVVVKLWGGDAKAYKDLAYGARQEQNKIQVFDGKEVPTVCLATYADFRIKDIASINDAGGVVSMKFAADIIERMCGAGSDGLVAQMDSRVPGADCVLLPNLYHSEPAMQMPGTKHPCGPLTQALLCCLFDKVRREGSGQAASTATAAPTTATATEPATAEQPAQAGGEAVPPPQ